ncbi:MAG: transposase, partial [Nitrospirales bacterium]|nr:transposase [Nitrospirales bacterium]
MTVKTWKISEELWQKVEPLLPKRTRTKRRKYKRRPGGGRKPMDPRKVFAAIIYVLRTGCQWKALPREYG